MSSTALQTSKKPARMTAKQAIRYWTARVKTEERQKGVLERRRATLDKAIQRQEAVIIWAMRGKESAEERWLLENPDADAADMGDY